MVTAYKIITGRKYPSKDFPKTIEEEVNQAIREGWIPQGGVCETSGSWLVQAMIKKGEK